MRKLAPFLAIAAVLCLVPLIPAPVGPSPAFALDDPAFWDGGSLVGCTDAGLGVTLDTYRTTAWNAAIRCEGVQARYKFCEFNLARIAVTEDGGCLDLDGGWVYDGGQNASQGTCTATSVNQQLDTNITYDIPIPSNRRFISLLFNTATSDDGGLPGCKVQSVTIPQP